MTETLSTAVLNVGLVGLRVWLWGALVVMRPWRALDETRMLVGHLADGLPIKGEKALECAAGPCQPVVAYSGKASVQISE